jgi:hypothetical protein
MQEITSIVLANTAPTAEDDTYTQNSTSYLIARTLYLSAINTFGATTVMDAVHDIKLSKF